MGISPKGNVIVGPEFELTYYDVTVKHFSHYTTWISGIFNAILLQLDKTLNLRLVKGNHSKNKQQIYFPRLVKTVKQLCLDILKVYFNVSFYLVFIQLSILIILSLGLEYSRTLWPGVAVPVRVPSIGQTAIIKSYSYSRGILNTS